MTTRAARDLVLVRATVATGLSLLLAIAAHASAGGLLPGRGVLIAMTALCFAGCALWLGRRASRRSLALLLLGAQATLHFAMSALAGHGGHGLAADTVGGALSDATHHVLVDLASTSGLAMTATHLTAAALAGLLLGQGERALWTVLQLLARAARFIALALPSLPRPVAFPDPTLRRAPVAGATSRRTSVWLADTHVRRGPPALLPAPAR